MRISISAEDDVEMERIKKLFAPLEVNGVPNTDAILCFKDEETWYVRRTKTGLSLKQIYKKEVFDGKR